MKESKSAQTDVRSEEAQDTNVHPEFTLEQLEAIFGTADPKIVMHRDYCNDFGGKE